MSPRRFTAVNDAERVASAAKAAEKGEFGLLRDLLGEAQAKLALRRGSAATLVDGLRGRLEGDGLSDAVGRPPTLATRATAASDGRLTRLVVLRLADDRDRPVGGVEVALLEPDRDGKLVDRVRSDRRGLALLRMASAGVPGTVADLEEAPLRVRVAGDDPLELSVPAGSQHVVHQLSVPEGSDGLGDTLEAAIEALEEAGDALGELSALEGVDDAAGTALETATSALTAAAEALEAATDAATDALEGAADAADAATAALEAAQAAADSVAATAAQLGAVAAVVAEAVEAVMAAAAALVEGIPDDSVVSRLPVAFSPSAADAVTRLLEVAEGLIPGLGPAVRGIAVSRTPLIKRTSVLRVVPGPATKPARRFLVRIRQEWTFVGYTLGRLVRVDSLDPGTVVGTLDASAAARADAFASLDASTASALRASLDARLAAHASVDTVLDVAARADLDSKLRAAARVGVRRDDEPITVESVGDFFANLGDNLVDALLPDLGAEAGADLDATVDVDSHTEFSLDSSLLATGRLNAAATLTNQATVAVSAALNVTASLSARATASVNPSLSRAVNLLRFELIENYAVVSAVEDVLEIAEEPIFGLDLPADLFPPADVLEYRRHFQPRLLERRLASHFEILRRAFASIRRGGDPVERVRIRVEYAAAPLAGADLRLTIAGRTRTLRLRPGAGVAEGILSLGGPRVPEDVDELRLALTTSPVSLGFPGVGGIGGGVFPGAGLPSAFLGATVQRIELRYRPGERPDVVFDATAPSTPALSVSGDDTATSRSIEIEPPELELDVETDPLVEHVRRNPHHYLGVLAEAALRRPALRLDAKQLEDVDPDLWKLPLLGFEGNVALRLVPVELTDELVKKLLADDGTATIVQLAAAGLYTEAAQGSLAITDALGKLHPALSSVLPSLDLGALAPIIAALAAQAGNGPGLPNIPGASVPGASSLLGGLGGT
ncbi:MAG: hypothetical protein WD844_17535 [Thermoleophilaceae bacterium]